MTVPDPIVVTIGCPADGCAYQFPATAAGGDAYRAHWMASHQTVHEARRRPVLSGTARVTKADGSVLEVPLTFPDEFTPPGD